MTDLCEGKRRRRASPSTGPADQSSGPCEQSIYGRHCKGATGSAVCFYVDAVEREREDEPSASEGRPRAVFVWSAYRHRSRRREDQFLKLGDRARGLWSFADRCEIGRRGSTQLAVQFSSGSRRGTKSSM